MIAPPSGTGYLGGDSPNVIVRNSQPYQTTVDLYCNKEWCGTQLSLPDGSWRFSNLDVNSLFDVVVRGAPVLDDIISSRRAPYAMPVIVAGGPLIDLGSTYEQQSITPVAEAVTGTAGPYSVSVVSGTSPDHFSMSVDGSNNLNVSGYGGIPGTYNFRIKITSSITANYCLLDLKIVIQSRTISLLHFDGTNGSTTFTDEYGSTWIPTSVTLSTSQFKYGSASGNFTGSTNNILSPTSIGTSIGSGDFTWEGWIYCTSLSAQYGVFSFSSGPVYGLYINTDQTLQLYGVSTAVNTTEKISLSLWTHLAFVKSAGVCSVFINGVKCSNTLSISTSLSGLACRLGNQNNLASPFIGYMDECRISTIARYTSNFTPPTAPFTY